VCAAMAATPSPTSPTSRCQVIGWPTTWRPGGGSMGPHDLATAPQQEAHSHAAGGGTLMPMSVQPRNARCQSFRRAKTWKTCQCFGPENAGPSFSSSTTSMVSSEASS